MEVMLAVSGRVYAGWVVDGVWSSSWQVVEFVEYEHEEWDNKMLFARVEESRQRSA
jgi:hypothetical protein